MCASAAHGQNLSNDTTKQIDQIFSTWNKADSPGCALGVYLGGRVAYKRGYGMANLNDDVPITPSTVFHVASMSKQFTAASILLLEQQGKLSLDDEVHKYIRLREAVFWFFLISKILMVIVTCHFVGLLVTHFAESAAIHSNSPEAYRAIRDGLTPLQFPVTFASCLYGLRWVLEDQRRRCPVCLHCLGSLQSHGERARILLNVSRSEKLCVNGHGSLIVPDFQTSWLATHLWELPNGPLIIAGR